MLGVGLGPSGAPLTVLCMGAHSDDVEIGCGGTLLRLLAERPGSRVHWVTFSASGARAGEARASAEAFLIDAAAVHVTLHDFRDGYFPAVADDVKDACEQLKSDLDASGVVPDLIFTHRRADAHQDHRTIGELTWNTFRDHLVAEYEIPKYEGDLGHPNLYVPLTAAVAERKVELLMEHFGSQRSRRWFRPEVFRASMALRAVECNAQAGFAEAFHAPKLVVG
jgi:LmbE family N-acetylglucosaminyl deacetylase